MKNWKYISITVLLLSVFSFISCTNAIEETEPSSETGTYLIIKSDGISLSRSINPRVDEELGKLKNIVLYGTKTADTGDTPITNGARRTLKSCASITELYNSQILLTDGAGKYTFELIGSFSPFNTMYYYDKNENVTIAENETNPVSFALAAVKSSTDYSEITGENGEHYGGINIKLSFDASKTNVSKVTVTVKTANAGAEETLVETKDLTISSSNSNSPKSVEYKREVSSTDANTGRIKTGTYRITFDFCWGTQVLNSIPYIVNVAYGLNTNFEDTIDLNEVYKITYNGNFGFQSNGVFSGETKVDYFSRKSDNIVLYLPYKANYVFDGWYDESDNIITYIPAGSTGNSQCTLA